MASEDRAQVIREAAVRVFSQKGYYETRAEEIAAEAKVAVGTIYNYFASKEEILLSIFEQEYATRRSFFEGLKDSELSVPQKIAQILADHFSLTQRNPELAQVLMQERFNRGTAFSESLCSFHGEVLTWIEALIQEGIDQGWVRPCDPRVIAPALFAVVESVSSWCVIRSGEAIEGLYGTAPEELADFIWKGLRGGEAG